MNYLLEIHKFNAIPTKISIKGRINRLGSFFSSRVDAKACARPRNSVTALNEDIK